MMSTVYLPDGGEGYTPSDDDPLVYPPAPEEYTFPSKGDEDDEDGEGQA